MFPVVSPVIPGRIPDPFDNLNWLFELKLDGFRGLAFIEPGGAHLVSKNGNRFRRFAPLCLSLAQLGIHPILDGEIACLGQDGCPLFYKLMRRRGTPAFFAFDLLWLNGQELRQLPETCRRDLEGIVAKPRMSRYGDNWLKIKNRAYSQNEGRRKMFERFQKGQVQVPEACKEH